MSVEPCVPIIHTLASGGVKRFAPHRLVGRIRAHRHPGGGPSVTHGMKGCGKVLDPSGTGLAARPTGAFLAPVGKLVGGKMAAALAGASLAGLVGLSSLHAGGTTDPGDPRAPVVTLQAGAPASTPVPVPVGVHVATVTSVPEPSSLCLLLGAASLALVLRYRRQFRVIVGVNPRPWRLPE